MDDTKAAHELLDALAFAKQAVLKTLEDSRVLVDMHGIAYWAGVVEELRSKLTKLI